MPIGVEMTFRVPNNSGAEHVKIDASDVKVPSTASWKEGEEPPKVSGVHARSECCNGVARFVFVFFFSLAL